MGFGSSKQSSNNSSQQTSTSFNQAYPFLQTALGDQVGNAGKGSNAIASFLGLGGSDDQSAAFNQFKNSSGYNFIQDEGVKSITGKNATRSVLNSGATLKGVSQYSSNLASGFLNSYLSNLLGLSNTGLQAGQILASAGSTANSQGTSYGNSRGSSFNATLG